MRYLKYWCYSYGLESFHHTILPAMGKRLAFDPVVPVREQRPQARREDPEAGARLQSLDSRSPATLPPKNTKS